VNSGTVLATAIKHPQPVSDKLSFLQILSKQAKKDIKHNDNNFTH